MDSKLSRRDLLTRASVVGAGLALGSVAATPSHAASSGDQSTIGGSIRRADFKKEKHVPVIETAIPHRRRSAFRANRFSGQRYSPPQHHRTLYQLDLCLF